MQITIISKPGLRLRLPRGWWLLPAVLGGAAIWVKIISAVIALFG